MLEKYHVDEYAKGNQTTLPSFEGRPKRQSSINYNRLVPVAIMTVACSIMAMSICWCLKQGAKEPDAHGLLRSSPLIGKVLFSCLRLLQTGGDFKSDVTSRYSQ